MCFIDESDLDINDCSLAKTVRARKPHACCECPRTIQPGEDYERFSGIYGGEPFSYATCARCARVRLALEREARMDHLVVPIGELRCCLRERAQERRFLAMEAIDAR